MRLKAPGREAAHTAVPKLSAAQLFRAKGACSVSPAQGKAGCVGGEMMALPRNGPGESLRLVRETLQVRLPLPRFC